MEPEWPARSVQINSTKVEWRGCVTPINVPLFALALAWLLVASVVASFAAHPMRHEEESDASVPLTHVHYCMYTLSFHKRKDGRSSRDVEEIININDTVHYSKA